MRRAGAIACAALAVVGLSRRARAEETGRAREGAVAEAAALEEVRPDAAAPGAAAPEAAAPGAAAPDEAPRRRGTAIEVRVEGERSSTSAARDPTAASYVIRGDELRAPGATASSVLGRVPGLQVVRTGAGADLATASIRGASSAETPVYLAGVRINDDVTGTADLSLVPLWMLHRVEVYRGNAPADADRLGIGGAIFFEPALPRGPRVGAGLGAGSFGELSASASASLGGERASVLVALSRRAADNDYPYIDDADTGLTAADDRTRTRQNADFEAYDLWTIGRYRLPRGGGVTALFNGFARDQGLSDLSARAAPPASPAAAARSRVQRWLGAVAAAVPCAGPRGGGVERCRLELRSSAILTRQSLRDPLQRHGLPAPFVASAGERAAEQGAVRFRVTDSVTAWASAAIELERLGIDHQASAPPLRALRATSRASASASFTPVPWLEVHALGAVEHHATRVAGDGGAAGLVEPSGRLGARLRLAEGAALFANVGRYVRVPALGELHGISPIVRGNPELEPEQGVTAELGARAAAALPRARAEVSLELLGFARLASALVAYRRSGLGAVRPYNVHGARVLGLELTASASALDHVRAALTLTALDPRDTSPERGIVSDLLPFQSRLVAAPSLEAYAEPGWLGGGRASLGARLLYRSSRVADRAGLIVLPEQATVDVELAVLALDGRLSGRLAVENATGARMLDAVGFALPGRSVHAAMEVWW
ncbi:TonB-dependent receptor plug domain-containing protein [Sorangium sp. So ce1389]|uniref:TonB-dependent receptor plug domain-containing protein n=1 Tax=Sorangium sp. So ce1389 TaxID=3133336 RepID=UPI003F606BCD